MMRFEGRSIGRFVGAVALGLVLSGQATTAAAAGPCQADSVVLGQIPGLTGPTPTDWFNVVGQDLDPTVVATVTFDVPVVPWSVEEPSVIQRAVSSFTIPKAYSAESFKWTFRARDPGVQAIHVAVAGRGCEAITRVDFLPPATSTADLAPDPGDGATPGPGTVLAVAFLFALLGANRRLARRLR
ncbi:MAG: hypothetical protein QOF49_707 [Chloroflexota bacterium]|nr:hypothetical protein [Chloroflexota bacterium]